MGRVDAELIFLLHGDVRQDKGNNLRNVRTQAQTHLPAAFESRSVDVKGPALGIRSLTS